MKQKPPAKTAIAAAPAKKTKPPQADAPKPPSATPRLTPAEFKFEATRRGWTYRALSVRWDVAENYLSRLANNVERPPHWDDAVRGLPTVMLVRKKPGRPAGKKTTPAAKKVA